MILNCLLLLIIVEYDENRNYKIVNETPSKDNNKLNAWNFIYK